MVNNLLEITDQVRNKESHNLTRQFVRRTNTKEKINNNNNNNENNYNNQGININELSLGKTMNDILLAWQNKSGVISQQEWRILNWHFANIEVFFSLENSVKIL